MFFMWEGYQPNRTTPNLEDQGLYFVWPVPFDLSSLDDPTRSLNSGQHSSGKGGMSLNLEVKNKVSPPFFNNQVYISKRLITLQ
jgi:hypothetical protein